MKTQNRHPMDRNTPSSTTKEAESQEKQIPIDGFNQVLEMLKIADPAFRESLLRRITARDQRLGNQLRQDLANFGL